MSMRVVATAGHVDHGKSTLIHALTGTDPDRFPEEKARGLTIDLGFAFTELKLDDGITRETSANVIIGFVDVPGHVKFVKNMLAGVGAVEVAMLIVAANEGWMPQTEEHVQILRLLGISYGLIVLTKRELVDDETLELAHLELIDHLAGTPMADWPVVSCDALSMQGLDEVRTALAAVLTEAPIAEDRERPRLWVDRSFAAKGSGTVVTGTLTLGSLAVHDEVVLEPGGRTARVRGLESHHRKLERVAAGTRVAVNLSGIDHTEVQRGDALVTPSVWATSRVVDVEIDRLDGAPLGARAALAVHVGSGEWPAKLRRLDDEGRYARLTFPHELALQPGDRLVLRSTGRRVTVGGATVLDLKPARRSADAIARLSKTLIPRTVAALGWASRSEIAMFAGLNAVVTDECIALSASSGDVHAIGELVVGREVVAQLRSDIPAKVSAHHRTQPNERGIEVGVLAAAVRTDPQHLRSFIDATDDLGIVVDQGVVRNRDHVGRASESPDGVAFLKALRSSLFSPPSVAETNTDIKIARALVREGAALDLDGVLFAPEAFEGARTLVSAALHERGSLTVSEIRDVLGSTRKYALPIVNALDAAGVTRRRGDDRIPGPRVTPKG